MSHTPGPWITEAADCSTENEPAITNYYILTPAGMAEGAPWIATVHGVHVSEKDQSINAANARLIAAAPELQDTVIELLKVAGACLRTLALTDEKFITIFDIELNREGVEDGFGVRARKVLAKSKGETYEPVMPVPPRAKATGGAQ